MIVSNDSNIYSAFFMEGLCLAQVRYGMEFTQTITEHYSSVSGGGGLELTMEMCQYARPLQELVDVAIRTRGNRNFAGTFEYDVCHEFGDWIGHRVLESGVVPPIAACLFKLAGDVITFFTQGEQETVCERIGVAVLAKSARMRDAMETEKFNRERETGVHRV